MIRPKIEIENIKDSDYIVETIKRFLMSKKRKIMIDGERYYEGNHDIVFSKREVIGENGELEEVKNLPNNRIVNNQYKRMVSQKVNYFLGKPFVVQTDNEKYDIELKNIFNRKFKKLIRNICQDSINCGIGWMYIFYDKFGKLNFKRFKPYEIIPIWEDTEHTILSAVIRVYKVLKIDKTNKEDWITKVELYDKSGIYYFILDENNLKAEEKAFENYFTIGTQGYNWQKIPIISFKYNNGISLLKNVKSLQDGLNKIISNFENNMEEDARNTILVLVNYDGESLGEFRKNLTTYGAVKVRSGEGGASGDLRTLQVEVNAENYKVIINIFKKAIIENAMGYDANDDKLSGNPNQLNIKSMYSDIDLDINGIEVEFQSSFEEIIWFIVCHLANIGIGDFEKETVNIIFNRDILMNESEVIDNLQKSVGILSEETLIAQHPWVDDPKKELERVRLEKENEINQYPVGNMNE